MDTKKATCPQPPFPFGSDGEVGTVKNHTSEKEGTPHSYYNVRNKDNFSSSSFCISNSLSNEFRTLSEQEFSEMVEAISTVKTEKTREKMSRILFYHICSMTRAI